MGRRPKSQPNNFLQQLGLPASSDLSLEVTQVALEAFISDPTPEPEIPLPSLEPDYLTVGDVTRYLQGLIEADDLLGSSVRIRGELSNVKRSARGHIYYTLKDEEASINGILWASAARLLPFDLEDGMEVDITGHLEIYAPHGTYSIVAKKIEPVGIGALQQAFEQLKARLAQEGLFDPENKQPLPPFPKRIGIVTSRTGAVIHDMLRVIRRKNPLIDVLLAPVKVQGDGAAIEIAMAIQELNDPHYDLDLIIVGRGGGSMEDLFCFSEEPVVRAISQSNLPVITGIGHEPDFSLADAAADYSAATPTMAADKATPDYEHLIETFYLYKENLLAMMSQYLMFFEQTLDTKASTFLDSHQRTLETAETQRALRAERLVNEMQKHLQQLEQAMAQGAATLEAFSPLTTLARGYALPTRADGSVIASAQALQPGETFRLKFSDGQRHCEVLADDQHPS